MIFGSDHKIQGIFVSHSALYDKGRNSTTKTLIPLLNQAVSVIKKHHLLKVDFNTVRFRLAPIKDMVEHFLGEFDHLDRLVTIDCRLAPSLFLNTLCHELIHAEQSFQKRLKVNVKKRIFIWEGHNFSIPEAEHTSANASFSDVSLREYLNIPWEYEAHIRESEIAKKVLKYF